MRKLLWLLVVGVFLIGGCETLRSSSGEGEVKIAPDAIPMKVSKAAQEAVPGLRIASADKETENGVVVYDIRGTADGVAYEVEVDENGNVGEIEKGDDAEDEDEEDDDHDDEDDDD